MREPKAENERSKILELESKRRRMREQKAENERAKG